MDKRECAHRYITERDDLDIPETHRRLDHGTSTRGGIGADEVDPPFDFYAQSFNCYFHLQSRIGPVARGRPARTAGCPPD